LEVALHECDLRFRRLVENAGEAFYLHDISGNIIDVNQRACASLGYTREEMLTLSVHDVGLSSGDDGTTGLWKRVVKGAPMTLEGIHRRKDGTACPVQLRIDTFQRDQRPLFLVLARDLTEPKRLEEQFLQSQKIGSVGRFAGSVAHDFGNMLTPILSYSELIARALPENQTRLHSYLREVIRASHRAADLSHQLLAFSRRQVIEPRVISLNDLIIATDNMIRRLIGEDIELVTLPAAHLWLIRVDPGQLEQVLVNLAVNARDAMPGGGKLVIRTANVNLDDDFGVHAPISGVKGHVLLSVADNGVGITDEAKARLFEPFFTTKEMGKGTGLGLSSSYSIVTQFGGHITVESEPGQGATFNVFLPMVDEAYLPPTSVEQPQILPVGDETVLLVEDEHSLRSVVSLVLREQGYTVLEAANGQEALGVAQKHAGKEIHLLLTDVVMPLMGGRELSERLHEANHGSRVLYISGYAEDETVTISGAKFQAAFMKKPFTPGALANRVREVLDAE
jgi:PAS domain S-box-containing protein